MFANLFTSCRRVSIRPQLIFKCLSPGTNVRQKYVGKTGAEIIYHKLLENDVKIACGYPGGAIIPTHDIFHPDYHNGSTPIQLVKSSNEENTGYVAEGYAKATGKPGVLLVTSGPGLTNIITPLQDALCDGVPMIAISGQVSTTAPPEAFQMCDSVKLTESCTKWNHKIRTLEELPAVLDYAFYIACSGRPGPVHIDIPKDIQMETYTDEHLNVKSSYLDKLKEKGEKEDVNNSSIVDDEQINRIVELIEASKRPILYVGQGANHCAKELSEFVEKTNIPVTTTLLALGVFDERHPLALNMLGLHGHPTPNFMIQKADLILAVGSRFDDRTVGALSAYGPNAREASKLGKGGFVHVDIRQTEKNRIVQVNEFVKSDCRVFLKALNECKFEYQSRRDWMQLMNHYKANFPVSVPEFSDGGISVQQVIREINTQIHDYREKCVFSTGIGIHQMVTAQLITWATPKSMITSGSLGTMGVALGYAIGAKLAHPDKTVISIDGDGSFDMTNTELKTVMNLDIPVKIIIMNNHSQLMVEHWLKMFYKGRLVGTGNKNCDYNILADAYGIHNLYCDNVKFLESTIKEFLEYDGPVLLNANLRKTPCLPLVRPGKPLDDMVLVDELYTER